jgi:hypothetical protein
LVTTGSRQEKSTADTGRSPISAGLGLVVETGVLDVTLGLGLATPDTGDGLHAKSARLTIARARLIAIPSNGLRDGALLDGRNPTCAGIRDY